MPELLLVVPDTDPEGVVAPLPPGQLVLPQEGEVDAVEGLDVRASVENGVEKPVETLSAARFPSVILKVEKYGHRHFHRKLLFSVGPVPLW